LNSIDIKGKNITSDALLTQRTFGAYLNKRGAFYFFTVKKNQKTLYEDIDLHFSEYDASSWDYVDVAPPDHGRIEIRKIRATTELNEYLNFPHVKQAFEISRTFIDPKTGKKIKDKKSKEKEKVYGITNRSTTEASPKKILEINRGHWSIENSCHYIIDWNYNEDRCRIRKGYGPEVITRIRRFAVGLIKSKKVLSTSQKMRQLLLNKRSVFDYLKMTKNSQKM
jgi:predicted transposase YbfD/YdcC